MNSVNLTGRLIHDPSRRDTPRGVVASFRLAVDARPRVWIDVEAWGHLAGTVATYLYARRHIAVTGRLAYAEYHDRNGHKQATYRVVADRIQFLDHADGGSSEGQTGSRDSAASSCSAGT